MQKNEWSPGQGASPENLLPAATPALENTPASVEVVPVAIPQPGLVSGAVLTTSQVPTPTKAATPEGRLSESWRWLIRNPKVAAGLVIVVFFALVAIFAPLIVHSNANAIDPNASLESPSAAHWLGTTETGQDIFKQIIMGTQTSMLLGFGAGALATVLSVVIGISAGYFGKLVDDILSLLINVFLVMPVLPLAIVLTTYFPIRGPLPIAIVVLISGWAWGARVLRSQTLSIRKREYIEAARSIGEKPWRIIFAEIFPNEIAIVASSFISTVIYAILAEVGLEFLGLGDITGNSWGNMFFWAQNNDALIRGAWWWFVTPGICIAVLGAGLSLINYGIDELANPRLRNSSRKIKKNRRVAA